MNNISTVIIIIIIVIRIKIYIIINIFHRKDRERGCRGIHLICGDFLLQPFQYGMILNFTFHPSLGTVMHKTKPVDKPIEQKWTESRELRIRTKKGYVHVIVGGKLIYTSISTSIY